MKKLLRHEDADIPNYDFATHQRTKEVTHLDKSYFILFEGILALHDKRIRDLMDLKLYTYEDDDVRLARRIRRDIRERGRDVIGVLKQWHHTVKPSFDEFVAPTMKHADLIVQGNETNKHAIQFIVENLTVKMINMGIAKKQIEEEELIMKSTIAHNVNKRMEAGVFDDLIKKLIEESHFEEMHIVYLTRKLREFYNPQSNIKITLMQNLNRKTSSKKGNLVKGKSMSNVEELVYSRTLAVYYPSLLKEEEINMALEKLSIIDTQYTHVDVLTLFGDQEHLQKLASDQNVRDNLTIEVFSIGSTPVLQSYEINVALANRIFVDEFKS